MKVKSCVGIIEQLFRKNGGWKRLQGELSVYFWPRIVGPEIAAKTDAEFFRNGYLYIKTDNPSLAHQLSLLSTDILKKFHMKLGRDSLKGIKIKIGTVSVKSSVNEEKCVRNLLNEENQKLVTECTGEIHDQKLAEIFGQTMQRALNYHQRLLADGAHRCQSCQVVIGSEFSYCPSCERKLNEETKALLEYLKKNQKTLSLEEMQMFDETKHPFLTELMKNEKTGGV